MTSSLWGLLAFLFTAAFCKGGSFDEPHPHQGTVTPYEPNAPDFKLNDKAVNMLKAGKMYKTQISEGGKGRGVVVVDINAPTAAVWSRILDFEHYKQMVTGVTYSSNYNVVDYKPSRSNKFLSQHIYTRMKIGFSMVTLEYFVKHSYHPKRNILTWTLDYDKSSDLDDSAGYWFVIPHPDDTGGENTRSRVYYSADANFPTWLPTFVQNFVSNKALGDATSWLKRESEKMAKPPKKKKGIIRFWKKTDGGKQPEAQKGLLDEHDEKVEYKAKMTFLSFALILYNIGLFLEVKRSK